MPNFTLMQQVLDQIEAFPHTWNQGAWRCSTGLCFAGWAVELAGGKWDPDHETRLDDGTHHKTPSDFATLPDGTHGHARTLALRVLDLPNEDVFIPRLDYDIDLFGGENTLDDLKDAVNALMHEHGYQPVDAHV